MNMAKTVHQNATSTLTGLFKSYISFSLLAFISILILPALSHAQTPEIVAGGGTSESPGRDAWTSIKMPALPLEAHATDWINRDPSSQLTPDRLLKTGPHARTPAAMIQIVIPPGPSRLLLEEANRETHSL